MRPFSRLKFITGTFLFLFLLPSVQGQTYRFRNYNALNGLSDTYIYTISQDNNGFLWIGTGSGLTRFDGTTFYNIQFSDSVANRYANVSHKDKNGTVWFGCNDGSVFYLKNNILNKLPDQGIQSINSILEANDGSILVISQDKTVLRIDANDPASIRRIIFALKSRESSASMILWSACLVSENKILFGTQENILNCSISGDSLQIENIIQGFDYAKISAILPAGTEGKYIAGTEGQGLFRISFSGEKQVLSRFPGHPELETADVRSLYRDNSGNIWISCAEHLYRLKISDNGETIVSETVFNNNSGLPGNDFRVVYQDSEENIWIGLYGDGLSVLPDDAFTFYTPFEKAEERNVIYIKGIKDNYLLGTPSGFFIFNLSTGKAEKFFNVSRSVRQTEVLSYYFEPSSEKLWIGTKGNGLYLSDLNGNIAQFFRSGNNSEDNIFHITSSGNSLWLSTLGGVIILDQKTGSVRNILGTEKRLPHNSIDEILIKKDGSAVVGTECDRLYDIVSDTIVRIGKVVMKGNFKNRILCLAEGKDGKLWAGTSGNGLFCFTNDTVYRFTTENGLLNNYCYSILADRDNNIWTGHERGFSRVDFSTGVIKTYLNDFAKGGNCNPHALFETSDGRVLIGTTEGLISYDRARDKKVIRPPVNNILQVTINDVKYPFKSHYTLPYNRRNKIVIDYVGIMMSNPDKVSYRMKMDNYDDDWSAATYSRQAQFNLSQGKYRFNLLSVCEGGETQQTPAGFEIVIKRPAWQTWWFILLVLSAISGIVVLIIRYREKAQRELKAYLESELAARTSEVMKQKEEIELQNIEITDSINYAKRIQSSILPDVNKLKETFADAFIFFHPRDIVSGDFYWFNKIDDEKFVIVCADSTGHGVPGAFMSMIGSTLLQDIISRKGITRPSEVLSMLDKEIFSTLNQNIDVGVSNDGMDMVICEYNKKTRHLRFASAMRPVIIVLQGEPYYIRGNRCSVGGESVVEKYFDDQEYYMSPGDTVYMFSDGLPDQFGGPDGKKLKIARLKGLIEGMAKLPMNEQREMVADFYFEWKGDYEQVDDILFMGLKV